MPNQLGAFLKAPRCYAKHLRKGRIARNAITRTKHEQGQLTTFLATQGTRLTLTATQIYAKVKKYGAARVKAATNSGQIP